MNETFTKSKKKNSIGISVFGYENKEKHPIYVSKKCCKEKHVDFLFIGEEGKRYYILIKDFDTSTLLYIVEENIFVVIVYRLLVQKNIKKSY